MNPSDLIITIAPFDALFIGVALAILAIAFYLLSTKHKSKAAMASAILFAYCSITLIAKFAMFFFVFGHKGYLSADFMDTYWFYLVINGLRPYALILAASFALYYAKSEHSKRVGL